jgi:DNA-binding transcriptional regulator YdaS (Cro superfamily)
MSDQSELSRTDSDRLAEIIRDLSIVQIRFVVARQETKSDKDAAALIGVSPSTVKQWDNKAQVDEAVRLMIYDGVVTARELRRRNLAKAMAIKVSGLDIEDDERLRQNVATEIIEGELGKPKQQTDITSDGKHIFAGAREILEKVYGE